jgi:hypothetical protein
MSIDADASLDQAFAQQTFQELGTQADLNVVLPRRLARVVGHIVNASEQIDLAICFAMNIE